MDQDNSLNSLIKVGTPSLKELKEFFFLNDESTPVQKKHPSMDSSESSEESLSDSFKIFLEDAKQKRKAKETSSKPQQLEDSVTSPTCVDASIYVKTPGAAETRKHFQRKFPLMTLNETQNTSSEMDPSFEEFLNMKRTRFIKAEVKEESYSLEEPTDKMYEKQSFTIKQSFHMKHQMVFADIKKVNIKESDSVLSPPIVNASIYIKTPGAAEARKFFNRKLPDAQPNTSSELDPSFEEFLRKKLEKQAKKEQEELIATLNTSSEMDPSFEEFLRKKRGRKAKKEEEFQQNCGENDSDDETSNSDLEQ